MEIKKAVSNRNLIFSLKGRLDTLTAPQLEEEIEATSFDDVETVTLNFKDVEYISSSGLRAVVGLYQKMTALGGNLKVINVNDVVMELFTMTGMADYMDVRGESAR